MRPEEIWPVDQEFAEDYKTMVCAGRAVARGSSVAVVAIARNAMPHLVNTLSLVDELSEHFLSFQWYSFENDSTDQTGEVLDEFASTREWAVSERATLSRGDYRGFEPGRLPALAEYRNKCLEWVRKNAPLSDYVIVLDCDPHGGFSVDGVMNSIAWMSRLGESAGAIASVSLYCRNVNGNTECAQYDAFAARLNWWSDRRETLGHSWFHLLLPPVGSPPIKMNSAFGGLAVYRTSAILAEGVSYSGEDCEHVLLHKSMATRGYNVFLNPGCRYVAVLPTE